MSEKNEIKDIELANILMQQYANLRQEIFQFMGYYKSYVRYFLTAVTLLVAFVAIVLKTDPIPYLGDGRTFLIFLMYAITTMVGFISFDILESQFSIIVLGSNLKLLEHQINSLVGRKIISWETEYAPQIKRAIRPFPGVLNPNACLIVFEAIIIVVAVFGPPAYWICSFWNTAPMLNRGFVVGDVIYSVATVIVLLIVGKGTLIDIDKLTAAIDPNIPKIEATKK